MDQRYHVISQRLLLPILLCITSLATGALAAPATKPARPDAAVLDALVKSGEPEKIAKAIEGIHILLQRDGYYAARMVRGRWGEPLLKQGRFAEALDIAAASVLAAASDANVVEDAQTLKVRALLGLGKSEQALAEAKSLYNVSTMKGTTKAIVLVCDCLKAARPDGGALAQKFKIEQLEIPEASDPAAKPRTVLAGIKVDDAQYADALDRQTGDSFNGLQEWGNLLLLSDKPEDARKIFEAAYKIATDKQLPTATECLARTMRAQDGSVARANAWVISLRPPDAPKNGVPANPAPTPPPPGK